MSDFHPSSWNPAWSVATILNGLLSFMTEDTPTTGSITTSASEKIILAKKSHKFNIDNMLYRNTFPDLVGSDDFVKDDVVNTAIKIETQVEENSVSFRSFTVIVLILLFYAFMTRILNRL